MAVSTDRRLGVNSGAAFKVPCRAATTGNITLSALQTIDGVALNDGERVLVWQQTIPLENGVYNASTGPWRRALDFNAEFDLKCGSMIWITNGASHALTLFRLTTADRTPTQGPMPDLDVLNFAVVTAATAADIFNIVQNFFTSSDNSIHIVNNSTNQTINITNISNAPQAGQVFEWYPTNNGGEMNGNLRTSGNAGAASDEAETEGTAPVDSILKLLYTQALVSSAQGPWFTGLNIRRGSIAGAGGFTFNAIWGTRATFPADTSIGFGLFSTISWSSFDPSANNIDQFCLGADAADANWQWIRRTAGAGAVTKVDLGLAKGTQQMFFVTISCASGVNSMTARVVQVTGYGAQTVLLNATYATNLPLATTALIPMWFARSATALSQSWLGYMKVVRPLNPAFN